MKNEKLYLAHILESIRRIEMYTTSGQADFLKDLKSQDAVIRNFEIMGEAAKRVSEEIRCKAPHIPWKRIAGFRDILIHQYEGVELAEVWNIVERNLADIKKDVELLLDQLDQG